LFYTLQHLIVDKVGYSNINRYLPGVDMTKILTRAKGYYYASIVTSLGATYHLVNENFVGVGIFLILSAALIAIGLLVNRKHKSET